MLPTAVVTTAKHELLCQGVLLLKLFQTQIVGCHVVLIHQHLVLQELVARGRGKEQSRHLVADGQSCVQHISFVAIHDGSGWVLNIVITFRQELPIAEAILVHILVVGCKVESQFFVRGKDEPYLAPRLVSEVVFLVKITIINKAF